MQRAENIRLRAGNDELAARVAELTAHVSELEALVEELRRAGKRQSAPFSKRPPKENPARPGRKPGEGYGTHGRRKPPEDVDDTVEAPRPEGCPGCGGDLDLERVDDQWIVDIPEMAKVVTRVRSRSVAADVVGAGSRDATRTRLPTPWGRRPPRSGPGPPPWPSSCTRAPGCRWPRRRRCSAAWA